VTKVNYKCLCGHNEDVHNFDPDSIMFGCLYEIITVKAVKHGFSRSTDTCQCREFKPDTLRYVEDVYAYHTNKKTN